MAGYWEFPGGKCEPGERPEDAAVRECGEELGLTVAIVRLRRVVSHRYPHAWVEMSFFDCVTIDPTAEPDPSTGFRWVRGSELAGLTFPGANEMVLKELARESADTQGG
jgi:mutator protein MutT